MNCQVLYVDAAMLTPRRIRSTLYLNRVIICIRLPQSQLLY